MSQEKTRRLVAVTPAQRRRNRLGDQVTTGLLIGIWSYAAGFHLVGKLVGVNLEFAGELLVLCVTIAALGVVILWFADIAEAGLWRVCLMVAPSLYVTGRNLYAGIVDFHGMTFVFVTLAIAAAKPKMSVLRVMMVLMLVTAVGSIFLGFVIPDAGIKHSDGEYTVRADKEVFSSLGLLVGIHTEENTMGQIMAMSLPLMLFVDNKWKRMAGISILLFALLWTSARGGQATAVVILLLMVVLPRIKRRHLRSGVERGVLAFTIVVCAAIPWFLRPADSAFSARGGIWRGSSDAWWDTSPLFGMGADWFVRRTHEASSPIINAAITGHNQFVHLAVTGGLVLIALALIQTVVFTWYTTRPWSRRDIVATLVITGVWVSGWLEYSFGFVDDVLVWPVTFPLLAVLLFCRDGGQPPRRAVRSRYPMKKEPRPHRSSGAAVTE